MRNKRADDADTVFTKYFDQNKYMDYFEGDESEEFAKRLMESS